MIEAKASLICVDSLLLWHLEAPLSTSEPSLPVSSFCLQHNNSTQCILLAETATNLSARNESEGSPCPNPHSPDTLPGWAQTQNLITFPLQSQTEAHCVPKRSSSQGARVCLASRRQRQGTMAVANFQYITRMSSGFKVYILEGKLVLSRFLRSPHVVWFKCTLTVISGVSAVAIHLYRTPLYI